MDVSKIPILNKFDLNDKTSRLKLILLVSAVIITVILICIVLAPDKSSPAQVVEQGVVIAQPIDIQNGAEDTNMRGKSNTDIYGRGSGGKRLADELFSRHDTIEIDDPLNDLMKDQETPKNTFPSNSGTPIHPGQPDVYGVKNESVDEVAASIRSSIPTSSSDNRPRTITKEDRERQYRERLIAMGIDPKTGQPFAQQQEITERSSASQVSSSSQQSKQEINVTQTEIAVSEEDFIDDDNSFGMGASGINSISKTHKRTDAPSIKVMFIEEKKVKNGDRVQLRLCEEKGITVDGVHLPKNSLLYASVDIGDRLEIKVPSVNVNGQIIPLNLEAYDIDGLKGIYCPVSDSEEVIKEGVKEAGRIVTGAVSSVMRNYGARIVSSGQSTADRLSSTKYVYITSGYSFRLMPAQ